MGKEWEGGCVGEGRGVPAAGCVADGVGEPRGRGWRSSEEGGRGEERRGFVRRSNREGKARGLVEGEVPLRCFG